MWVSAGKPRYSMGTPAVEAVFNPRAQRDSGSSFLLQRYYYTPDEARKAYALQQIT